MLRYEKHDKKLTGKIVCVHEVFRFVLPEDAATAVVVVALSVVVVGLDGVEVGVHGGVVADLGRRRRGGPGLEALLAASGDHVRAERKNKTVPVP